MQPPVVVPVDPAGGGERDVGDGPVRLFVEDGGAMHSVLNSPMTVAIRALSLASPTVPIEGAISAMARCSVKRIEVYWASSTSRCNTSLLMRE